MGPRNGVPATHSASQTRVNALLRSRGAPRGDDDPRLWSHLAKTTAFLVPAARFCARGLQLCFAHPNRGVGGAPRNVRVLGGTPVRRAHNAARQAPSEAPCVP